jgi:hypothetical protein
LPRGSCPYAGTTRIRFEGLPRPIFPGRRRLSPLSGHPLDLAIIRKLSPVGQGCGLMTEEAAVPFAGSGPIIGSPGSGSAAPFIQNCVKFN